MLNSMMFEIKGKPKHVSVTQVRAYVQATLIVLGFHGKHPLKPFSVLITKDNFERSGQGYCGMYSPGSDVALITLNGHNIPEEMFTTCVHETIHACIDFPKETEESCTSSLCARIKPDVHRIAEVLLEGQMRRAAYLAHTKIAYVAKGDDYYNRDEDIPVGVREPRRPIVLPRSR